MNASQVFFQRRVPYRTDGVRTTTCVLFIIEDDKRAGKSECAVQNNPGRMT